MSIFVLKTLVLKKVEYIIQCVDEYFKRQYCTIVQTERSQLDCKAFPIRVWLNK